MAEITQTAPDGTTVTAKPERSVRWAVYVVICTTPLLIAMLWWMLGSLTPAKWCAVQVNAARITGTGGAAVQDCQPTVLAMLGIYKTATWGLLAAIVVSHLIMVAMLLRAGVNLTGPMGWKLDLSAQDRSNGKDEG